MRLPHAPGLDGIRGLAVLAVLVTHAGPARWLPGGFLGVSLFFTLSGYLIGSLVLAEVEGAGGVDLPRFWARRARRLIPALVVTVWGVAVLSRLVDLPDSTRVELLAGLAYVANWAQVAGGESYAQLFESPSAATHLWSLAIEEQFYVVFPFVVWLVARRAPHRMAAVFVGGGLAAMFAGVLVTRAVDGQVFAYYATVARLPEIALGAVVAGLAPLHRVHGWWHTPNPEADRHARARRAVNAVGMSALAAMLVSWRWVDLSTGWVYRGGLAVLALVWVAVIFGALAPGPVSRVVSVPPLLGLGRISYGLYLYHWPVVVVLSPPRVELGEWPLFGVRVAVSLALAVVSYRWLEQPIRSGLGGRLSSSTATLWVALAALVASAVVVVAVVPGPQPGPAPPRPAPAVVPGTGTTPGTTTDSTPGTVGPPALVVLGDSLPNWLLRDGGWSLDPAEVTVVDGTGEGCDGAEGAPVGRAGTGVVVTLPASCTGWTEQYPPVLEGRELDAAVLVLGMGAVLDRRLDGEFVGPCEPAARDWYRDDVAARIDHLAEQVDTVVLVLPPWAEDWSGWVYPSDHLARTDCVRATLLAAVEQSRAGGRDDGTVAVVDLADLICPEGPGACEPWRTQDGVHVDPDRAGQVLSWVVDRSLAALP